MNSLTRDVHGLEWPKGGLIGGTSVRIPSEAINSGTWTLQKEASLKSSFKLGVIIQT